MTGSVPSASGGVTMRTRTSPTAAGTVIQRSSTASLSIGAACNSSSTARASAGLISYRNGGPAVASASPCEAGSSTTGGCVSITDMCGLLRVWRDLRREACVDVGGELLRVLGQEPVAGVGIDLELGVGETLSEQAAVPRVHHRVVVAVGDERRLG